MSQSSKTVFVLGAGFTRAFFPKAPLQVDHYEIDPLLERYQSFDLARRVLEFEKDRAVDGKINIERLFTRLEGMPYDREDAYLQYDSLRSDLLRVFQDRLKAATADQALPDALRNFARYCVNNSITCITFNYDDVLDKALALVAALNPVGALFLDKYWHPDGGYGFFCQSSSSCLGVNPWAHGVSTSMYLLKLHGSINWRIKVGFTKPYPLGGIVHHERWTTPMNVDDPTDQAIESHLTDEPFIVPPVLGKFALEEPILRQIWGKARVALRDAEDGVVFVGYSCPVTDLAATFLLGSTVPLKGSRVTVVNKPEDSKGEQQVKETYRKIFPNIEESGFRFIDALAWAQELENKSA